MKRLSCLAACACIFGGVLAGPNRPPNASFTVNVDVGTIGTTFTVDASATTDDHTQLKNLVFRWTWETGTVPQTAPKITTHQYAGEGIKMIHLDVVDQGGLIGTFARTVTVQPTQVTRLVANPPSVPGAAESDIDFSPADPQRVVMSAVTFEDGSGAPDYPAFVSTDGGTNWTRATGIPGVHALDAQIEFGLSGNVFLSAVDNEALQVSRSQDGGFTYTSSSMAMDGNTLFRFPDGSFHSADPCTVAPLLLFDRPVIKVDRGVASRNPGYLYALAEADWFSDPDGDGRCEGSYTMFVRSTDQGQSWDAPQSFGYQQGGVAIGVGANGDVYVAGTPQGASPCPGGAGMILRKSTNGGMTFGPPACIAPVVGAYPAWPAAHPTDPSSVVVAYLQVLPSISNTPHVFLIRSIDAGTSWSAPARIDDVLPDDAVTHLYMTVSISSNGRIDAA